ncbi:MAG: ABC transporter substrate-binding protein [Oscillospiraceae bacterium]|nr:ABC transporter substrate-binding protein [Oscillospiraceae bacterium]
MKKLFSVLLAVSMVVSLAACGQTAKNDTYTVGICQLVQHEALDAATKGFKDALTEELGDKVKFEEQNASGDSNACSTIINGFVSKNVDLIMANATPALQAASAGTSTIPILGTSVTEYGVALELDNFNGVVGGNISGTSDLAPLDKQAELLLSIFPDAKNVGLLYCSAEPNSIYQVKVVKEYLEGKGVTCKEFSFSDTNDIAAVTTSACKFSDVIYLPTDNQVAASTGIIDGICRPAKIPVISGEEGICAGCGVATLSISYYELGRKTGLMAARILRDGEDISKMPIEYDENYKKKYNKEICDELGIKVPDDFEEIK